jgi:hypothetical protein
MYTYQSVYFPVISPEIDLQVVLEDSKPADVVIDAPVKILVEVLQQLAWLGAAFQTSRSGRIEYSNAVVTVVPGVLRPNFDIRFSLKPLRKQETTCWHPLFSNPVLASGFPIPQRGPEVGLEIPLPMMAALGGVRHSIEYNGGILLKGFSSAFVPMKCEDDAIQWHFIQNDDENIRLFYAEVDKKCLGRALLDEVDQASLKATRAFLGWWGEASTHLGTADTQYGNLDWSSTPQVDRLPTFSGGSFGFQNFATAELNFRIGAKDGKLHLSRKGWYQRIIRCAASTSTILYDSNERRAWLVPTSAVILHIAHTRCYRTPHYSHDIYPALAYADPGKDSYDAAARALLQNATAKLSDNDELGEPDYLFRDLVFDQWSILESLVERQVVKEAIPEKEIRLAVKPQLRGWEFMDLVDDNSPLIQREVSLLSSSGDWTSFARDINAIVLFASGFGDIIKPILSPSVGLCHRWRTVPKDKDYLTATISTINRLFEKAGSKYTQEHLTPSHIRWHRGSKLFDACTDQNSFQCSCDRVQEVVSKSLARFRNIVPPGPLEEKGAVIFGKPTTSLRSIKSDDLQIRRKELYSQPNLPLLLCTDRPRLAAIASPEEGRSPCVPGLDTSTTVTTSDGEEVPRPSTTASVSDEIKANLLLPLKRPFEEEEGYFLNSPNFHRRRSFQKDALDSHEEYIIGYQNSAIQSLSLELDLCSALPRRNSIITSPLEQKVSLRRKPNLVPLHEGGRPST